jgi:hypothetical protein
MKRYKLVKEYPGSPDKGTIVYRPHRNNFGGWEMDYKERNPDRYTSNNIYHYKDNIEKFPEFWKLIK